MTTSRRNAWRSISHWVRQRYWLRSAGILVSMLLLSACVSGPTVSAKDDTPESSYFQWFEGLSIDEKIAVGDQAAQTGEGEMALMLYLKITQTDDRPDVWFKIGKLEEHPGNEGAAAQAFNRVLQLDPDHAGAHEGLGLQLLSARKTDAARTHLETAIQLDPRRWRTQNALGVLDDMRKDHLSALSHYQAALEINPDSTMLLNNCGYSYYLAGDLDRAAGYFESALRIDVGYKSAIANLGLLYARKGRYEDATVVLGKVMEQPQAFNDVGYIALRSGHLEDAERLLSEAIRLSPRYYAIAVENLKRAREAIERFESTGLDDHFTAYSSQLKITEIRYSEYRRVETHTLNVRDTDDASAAVVGFLKSGDEVDVIRVKNGWALVSFATNRDLIADLGPDESSVTTTVNSLWIRPRDFTQEPERIRELAIALEMDREVLAHNLARNDDQESWYFIRYVDPSAAAALDEQQIHGVHLLSEYWGDLPAGTTLQTDVGNNAPATGWVLARFLSQPLGLESS